MVVELRVHGVGGSHGVRPLSVADAQDADLVVDGEETAVYQRRGDDADPGGTAVRCYDWGGLTSGRWWHALWVLLLPYTLLNAAGWMRAPGASNSLQARAHRATVVALGWLMTVWYVVWSVQIVVGLICDQWARRKVDPNGVDPPLLPHMSEGAAEDAVLWAGVILTFVTGAALFYLAFTTRASTAPHAAFVGDAPRPPTSGRGQPCWRDGDDEAGMTSTTFFATHRTRSASVTTHAVIGAGAWAWACWTLLRRPSVTAPAAASLDGGFRLLTALTLLGLVAVAACTWWWPRAASGRDGGPFGLATSACVGALLVGIVFAGGLELWVARMLGTGGETPEALAVGPHSALASAAIVALGLWVIAGALAVVAWWTAPWWWRSSRRSHDVTRARAVAAVAHRADTIARVLTSMSAVAAVASLAVSLDDERPGLHFAPTDPTEMRHRLAAWAFTGLVAWYVLRLRSIGGATQVGRLFGQVWDVLTFWPRRFHPLAVRPYARRAVPELRSLVTAAVDDGAGIVLSAHSQGSMLAVAALGPLPALDRVRLVTYGSPLGVLIGRAFPAYCSTTFFAGLRDRLPDDGWVNFHRATDPIGGSIPGVPDRVLEDPTTDDDDTTVAGRAALVERTRRPSDGLAVHSHYLRERRLQETSQTMVDDLVNGAGADAAR